MSVTRLGMDGKAAFGACDDGRDDRRADWIVDERG